MEKKICKIEHNDKKHEKIILVNWIMGNECNFACSYCPPELHNNTHNWSSLKGVVLFTEKLVKHYLTDTNKKLFFCLTGGEITLHKELIEILHYFKANKWGVGILSNGSRELNYWKKLKPLLDHVCITYHPTMTKETHVYDVVKLLQTSVTTHVNIMMHPAYFDRSRNIGLKLIAELNNFTISFQPLMKMLGECHELMEYSNEQIVEMSLLESKTNIRWDRELNTYRGNMKITYSDNSTEIISAAALSIQQRAKFKGYKCFAGLEMLTIFYNGDIYPCWCYEEECIGKIGNIYDNNNIKFPDNPIRCVCDYCWDIADVMITKEI